MGTADIVTKEYMRENTVFADAFNYLIYNGKKVIDPAKLTEIDSTEIALPFGNAEKVKAEKKRKEQEAEWSSVKNESVRKKNTSRVGVKMDAVQKYRDVFKSMVIKQDEKRLTFFWASKTRRTCIMQCRSEMLFMMHCNMADRWRI
nr:hypothetical protein [Roseburia sp. OF03-24]